MPTCKHDVSFLTGTADGIVCRRCGAKFKSFADIGKDIGNATEAPETPKEPAKRARKKKGVTNNA